MKLTGWAWARGSPRNSPIMKTHVYLSIYLLPDFGGEIAPSPVTTGESARCDQSHLIDLSVVTGEEAVIADFAGKSDEELMSLYQQAEYGAFEELYFRHSSRVYGYFKNRLNLPGEAEDLLQHTFLKLHQARANYNGTLPFLPWLFSIARNLLIDHLRKHRPTVIEADKLMALAEKASQGGNPEPVVSWDEVMKLLPDDQRQIIQQRFEEGLSFEDIARLSGVNEASARKRLSRTVQGLRKIFQGKGER